MIPPTAMPRVGETVTIEGQEARHALRVKRVSDGADVEVLNGRGLRATGIATQQGRAVIVTIEHVDVASPTHPRVEVFASPPKGGRVDDMVRGLSQVGAAAWTPLQAARNVADARLAKRERLDAIALESAKQCGRAWALDITAPAAFEQALQPQADGSVIVADASGPPYRPTGADVIRVLVGPEGGWSDQERAAADAAQICSFGVHVMRIEVASVAAAAIVLDAERRRGE